MQKYKDTLENCALFAGVGWVDLGVLLSCLGATIRHYDKNQFIFAAGDKVTAVGIVLDGSAHVLQEDFWGSRSILANIGRGGLFGEAFSCAGTAQLPVGVVAAETSCCMLIDYRKIINTCSSSCSFHTLLVSNMIKILAGKNLMLTQKIEIITRRTTREKLLAYLCAQARHAGSGSFTIPFNRQELADYLSVDRSAMSSELSKMRSEGILRFDRSRFELLRDSAGQ